MKIGKRTKPTLSTAMKIAAILHVKPRNRAERRRNEQYLKKLEKSGFVTRKEENETASE